MALAFGLVLLALVYTVRALQSAWLTLIQFNPITNTFVNAARSFSPAVFVGDWALN